MNKKNNNKQTFIEQHKGSFQTVSFLIIIILPFLLYLSAQANQNIVVSILLGLMALTMLLIILMS
jgi:hypothetical protein